MIDFETRGISDFPVLISVGIVSFDESHVFDKFKQNICPKSCSDIGTLTDRDTIMFWAEQSPDVYESLVHDAKPIWDVLKMIMDEIRGADELWSNGSLQDALWLRNYLSKYNIDLYPVVNGFRAVKCFRTIKGSNDIVAIPDTGPKHDPLCDAIWQAKYLIELNKTHNILR